MSHETASRFGGVGDVRALPSWPALVPLAGVAIVIAAVLVSQPAERPLLVGGSAVAALAGLTATSLGVFGGVLVPGLLLLGVAPRAVVAMSLLLQVLVIPVGATSHAAVGHVRRAITVPLIAGGVIGSVAGALLASVVPTELVARAIAVVIVVVGLIVLANLRPGATRLDGRPIGRSRIAGIGLVAGVASGISGAGWGPIGVKLLILGRIDPRHAIGSSLVGRVAMALAALAAYSASASILGTALLQPPLVVALLGASIATMIPGTLLIARVGRGPAATLVALLSIALALPTAAGWP